ncbi:hypothetical protein HYH03_012096 [Edaphochlamys debaryana]|uniref:PARP n=1 Tax=Edaphochlamys debaryana TaxID=47281 RepID=A0A836BUI9_9CHLO|nr:hypothetical protein HYH03_012096 [Edaphochlamys debaryana]|eukprot:KAG2489460.1 hypothetical protein HYH03_012096 [Edaphochlamys debaryana]
MSTTESQNSIQELIAEIKAYPDGTDLLLAALYTAAYHYRRSTICTPFPSEVLPPLPDSKDKDYVALQRALSHIPAVHSLLGSDDVLRGLPQPCVPLLQWLLLNPTRRRRFTLCPLGEMMRQLKQRCPNGGWQLPAFAGNNSPSLVLRAHEGHEQEPFARGTVAYHGTHLENLHSIIHTGLQSGSGTRLQRTGANFGSGVYLSTVYSTAFSFCQPSASWPRSRFGSKLRVMLVCEVDLDRACTEGAPGAGAGGGSAVSSGPALPDTYLLVQRPDALRLLFLMVYADAPAGHAVRPAGRVNWCTVMVVLYAAFLVGKALLSAMRHHRY